MVNKYSFRLLVFISMALIISCTQSNDSNEIEITEVTGSGTDNNSKEFCSDFTVSQEAAAEFFKRAKPISFKQLHDEYDYLPCYSNGTARIGSDSCTWEIRAGNTGELRCGTTVEHFACDDCLDAQ